MKIKIFFLFLMASIFAQAQDGTYDGDVKHFIEINGTMSQYHTAVGQLTTMLQSQYKAGNVSETDWNEVRTLAKNSLVGLSDDLVVVYKKFFTHEEIQELNKLYENAVAQKFITNVLNLTAASQDVSIVWSRSLYNQATDLLHEKGYSK